MLKNFFSFLNDAPDIKEQVCALGKRFKPSLMFPGETKMLYSNGMLMYGLIGAKEGGSSWPRSQILEAAEKAWVLTNTLCLNVTVSYLLLFVTDSGTK
jgi:hypothetical protein